MKRLFHIFLCVFTLVYLPSVSARSRMLDTPLYEENYSWDINDRCQKKQAIGMAVTGVVFFFLIAVISGSIETDSDNTDVAPFTGPETDNTIVS